jgi:hypothetical protein
MVKLEELLLTLLLLLLLLLDYRYRSSDHKNGKLISRTIYRYYLRTHNNGSTKSFFSRRCYCCCWLLDYRYSYRSDHKRTEN